MSFPTPMKKIRKPKKRPANKPRPDVNQLAAKLVQKTIRESEK